MLNDESADVPEDIVMDWSLRSATATGTPRKPFSVWKTVMPVCGCFGVHYVIYGLIVKSLADYHPSFTTTPM